jgi:hypothetical protein
MGWGALKALGKPNAYLVVQAPVVVKVLIVLDDEIEHRRSLGDINRGLPPVPLTATLCRHHLHILHM